jgi:transcriptional regulator with XRE-family HTH domain
VNARHRIRANLERLVALAVEVARSERPGVTELEVLAAIVDAAALAPGLTRRSHRAGLLRRFLTGERTPTLETLDALAGALGVSVAEFFRDPVKPP